MSWQNSQNDNPDLAETGRMWLNGRVSYLTTVRANVAPRVHPVTPSIVVWKIMPG